MSHSSFQSRITVLPKTGLKKPSQIKTKTSFRSSDKSPSTNSSANEQFVLRRQDSPPKEKKNAFPEKTKLGSVKSPAVFMKKEGKEKKSQVFSQKSPILGKQVSSPSSSPFRKPKLSPRTVLGNSVKTGIGHGGGSIPQKSFSYVSSTPPTAIRTKNVINTESAENDTAIRSPSKFSMPFGSLRNNAADKKSTNLSTPKNHVVSKDYSSLRATSHKSALPEQETCKSLQSSPEIELSSFSNGNTSFQNKTKPPTNSESDEKNNFNVSTVIYESEATERFDTASRSQKNFQKPKNQVLFGKTTPAKEKSLKAVAIPKVPNLSLETEKISPQNGVHPQKFTPKLNLKNIEMSSSSLQRTQSLNYKKQEVVSKNSFASVKRSNSEAGKDVMTNKNKSNRGKRSLFGLHRTKTDSNSKVQTKSSPNNQTENKSNSPKNQAFNENFSEKRLDEISKLPKSNFENSPKQKSAFGFYKFKKTNKSPTKENKKSNATRLDSNNTSNAIHAPETDPSERVIPNSNLLNHLSSSSLLKSPSASSSLNESGVSNLSGTMSLRSKKVSFQNDITISDGSSVETRTNGLRSFDEYKSAFARKSNSTSSASTEKVFDKFNFTSQTAEIEKRNILNPHTPLSLPLSYPYPNDLKAKEDSSPLDLQNTHPHSNVDIGYQNAFFESQKPDYYAQYTPNYVVIPQEISPLPHSSEHYVLSCESPVPYILPHEDYIESNPQNQFDTLKNRAENFNQLGATNQIYNRERASFPTNIIEQENKKDHQLHTEPSNHWSQQTENAYFGTNSKLTLKQRNTPPADPLESPLYYECCSSSSSIPPFTNISTPKISSPAQYKNTPNSLASPQDFKQFEPLRFSDHRQQLEQNISTNTIRKQHVNRLLLLRSATKSLKTEIKELKKQQQINMEKTNQMLQTKMEEVMRIFSSSSFSPLRSRRAQLDQLRHQYDTSSSQNEFQLREVEAGVESLRNDVVARRCLVRAGVVEPLVLKLSEVGHKIAGTKGSFRNLQEELRTVGTAEVEIVYSEEKFVSSEPIRIDEQLKRCKQLTVTLFTLKKLSNIQEARSNTPQFMSPYATLSLSRNMRSMKIHGDQAAPEKKFLDDARILNVNNIETPENVKVSEAAEKSLNKNDYTSENKDYNQTNFLDLPRSEDTAQNRNSIASGYSSIDSLPLPPAYLTQPYIKPDDRNSTLDKLFHTDVDAETSPKSSNNSTPTSSLHCEPMELLLPQNHGTWNPVNRSNSAIPYHMGYRFPNSMREPYPHYLTQHKKDFSKVQAVERSNSVPPHHGYFANTQNFQQKKLPSNFNNDSSFDFHEVQEQKR